MSLLSDDMINYTDNFKRTDKKSPRTNNDYSKFVG